MSRTIPVLKMNDGFTIPQLGLGMMFMPRDILEELMLQAMRMGYRQFDTATHYDNEALIGDALKRSEVDREELFLTTKLPDGQHGYDAAMRAFDRSERAIGRIDLYLIHWPQPSKGLYRETWRALVRLHKEGRVRSIGVANFTPPLIDELIDDTGTVPAVNQIQLHPRYQQREVRDYHAHRRIITQAWSPLEHGRALTDPIIGQIAKRLGRSPAQIVLRWHVQNELVVIPKAASSRHLADNIEIYDFALEKGDLALIKGLDSVSGRIGPDPLMHVSDRGDD